MAAAPDTAIPAVGAVVDHHHTLYNTPARSYSTRSSRPSPPDDYYYPSNPVGHDQATVSLTQSQSASASAAARAQQYRHRRSSSSSAVPSSPAVASYNRHLDNHHRQQQQQAQSHHVSGTVPPVQPQRHHRRTSSSIRPLPEILPENDCEASNVAIYPQRSSSRDRPAHPSSSNPPARSAADVEPPRLAHRRSGSSRQTNHHRTSSQVQSTHNSRNMAPSANGASAPSGAPADGTHSSSGKQTRSRTTIPTQSGKWILGKTIGAGSMGKVKLARKEDGSEQVACKIIPRGSTDDSHQSRADKERADQSKEIRTAREAAIVTLLNHPHICGLRDVVRTNYHWYMLFEFVNGGQMLDYIISHGKLKEKQARKFSRQIASALDYCHRNSIVHRDLKIENILISKTGDIKIIDFGLSNLFAPRGHLKTFCGSLYFAAPELLQARAYTGPEVDVWSFGIVLYVLVCGKVPFDDQSMPALHAKIKKGVVDYPSWLSTECKHLMSRMLVTDPKMRATMQEVMTHPWMTKGFNGPPDNFLPVREPLSPPLEPEVIHAMQGFNFGSPESIRAQLTKIIDSEEYQRAVMLHQKEKEMPQPNREGEKKRGFGFDFYKRRNSGTSRDTLTGPSSEALQLGNDPLNAFSPLLSIYYLVKEKQDRERPEGSAPAPSTPREKEKERERDRDRDREQREHREHRDPRDHRERSREERERPVDALPEIAPPQAAVTNATRYEMPGEQPTGGRTRPRARTHGEDDAPDTAKQATPPEHRPEQQPQKKESAASGLLRRFSTRKRRDPERLDKDRSHPPVVQVHSPADGSSLTPRKSFSIRRGRRERDGSAEPRLRSGSSQPQHSELLSPPATAGGSRESRRGGLGRSTSVNSAEMRRQKARGAAKEPPPTSGSDQSMAEEPPAGPSRGHGHSKSVAYRAKSLGHARRESIQQRRMRREAAQEANVPEETDQEQEASGVSTERLDSSDLAKPVFLKGLFSVSTTSGKSVPAIRADIRRVLRQLNVDFVEIKGGFTCKYMPSIDLNKVQDPPGSPGPTSAGGGHRRRFSFGGLMRGDDREDVRDPSDRPPTTPRTPGRSDRDRSYSNSETSVDSIPRRANHGNSRRAPGETSTQVQSDLGGSMVLEFEIFIVKVPLLTLHGIQFKRLDGNTWQYKNMADQILRELRL